MKHVGFFGLAALLLAACGSNADTIDTSAVKPVVAGTLTTCSDVPYEPFELGDPGSESGIDVDLVKAIASDLGYKAAFKDVDFDEIFSAMERGECDLIASSVSITDERKAKYLFSDGYFEINQSLLVRSADAKTYPNLASLSGHTIAVQSGTTGETYAKAKATEGTAVRGLDSADVMFAALQNKEVDAILQDFPVNSYFAKKNPGFEVVTTFTDVDREQYGFVLKKSDTALQGAVNKSLGKIRKDGRYDKILATYLGNASAG